MSSSTKIAFSHHSNFNDSVRDDVKIALRKIIPEVKQINHYYQLANCDALCLLLENGKFELSKNNLGQIQKDTLVAANNTGLPVFIAYKPINSISYGQWRFYKMNMDLYKDEGVVAGIQGSYNVIYCICPKSPTPLQGTPSQGITTSVQNRNILLLL